MKKYLFFIFVAAFAISSCCKKTACVEIHSIPVTFYGFTAAEVDTIYTTGYIAGSGFTNISRAEEKDTARHMYNLPDGTFSLELREPHLSSQFGHDASLYDAHEWKIYIPSVNKTIFIHNYGYNSYRCNGCGFRRGEEVKSLSTCSVNDSTKKVDDIRIYK